MPPSSVERRAALLRYLQDQTAPQSPVTIYRALREAVYPDTRSDTLRRDLAALRREGFVEEVSVLVRGRCWQIRRD